MTAITPTELAHRAAITDTLHAYARGVDRCDFDLLADLFSTEATFDYGHGNITQGTSALRELFKTATGKYAATNHHVSTINFLEVNDETASTIAYVYAFHDNTNDGTHVHVWGCYEDELVNEGDRWRIRARKVRIAGAKVTDRDPIPERFEQYPRANPNQ